MAGRITIILITAETFAASPEIPETPKYLNHLMAHGDLATPRSALALKQRTNWPTTLATTPS